MYKQLKSHKMRSKKSKRHFFDIWPGFVDALATLLMALIFVLMIFVISQRYMGEILHGREKSLRDLGGQFDQLAKMLNLEKEKNKTLEKSFFTLKQNYKDAKKFIFETESKISYLENQSIFKDQEKKTKEYQIQELSKQIEILNSHLKGLSLNLKTTKNENEQKETKIKSLLEKLKALKTTTNEFNLAKYRSEFFEKLQQALGNRNDINIRGDRFVFQSEVLFASGSWDLQNEGKKQLEHLAQTLKKITTTFPKEINWILRIDGHTDKNPIKNTVIKSNWELSSNRAISVVNFLILQGIPPHRLAATGFGEFQPIDERDAEDAHTKNRRIEIKLDQF